VVGFDVLPETLSGIEGGIVYATMRQAQYDIGFDTVRTLAETLVGDARMVAASSPMRYLAVTAVTKDNLAKVRQEMGQGAAVASAAK
jgi:ABC-type sugar transport system substrate-binding protein